MQTARAAPQPQRDLPRGQPRLSVAADGPLPVGAGAVDQPEVARARRELPEGASRNGAVSPWPSTPRAPPGPSCRPRPARRLAAPGSAPRSPRRWDRSSPGTPPGRPVAPSSQPAPLAGRAGESPGWRSPAPRRHRTGVQTSRRRRSRPARPSGCPTRRPTRSTPATAMSTSSTILPKMPRPVGVAVDPPRAAEEAVGRAAAAAPINRTAAAPPAPDSPHLRLHRPPARSPAYTAPAPTPCRPPRRRVREPPVVRPSFTWQQQPANSAIRTARLSRSRKPAERLQQGLAGFGKWPSNVEAPTVWPIAWPQCLPNLRRAERRGCSSASFARSAKPSATAYWDTSATR